MRDLRLALRALTRRPGFTALAVLTLSLGIGANTAVFTVLHAVLLAPLPYADPGRLVVLTERTPQFPNVTTTRFNYDDWRTRARSFSGMGAIRTTSGTVTGAGEPERVPTRMITANLLPILGVQVESGRGFTESDDRPGAPGTAIVTAGFASRKFGNAGPLGRVVQIDGEPHTIVGVLPARFELFQPADIYVPFGPWAATLPDDRGWRQGIVPIARLAAGVTIEDARVEMDTIAAQLEAEHPDSNRNVRVSVTRLEDQLVQNVRPALVLLFGAVTLVLLIACANVANLLLARAVERQKEIAVRIAIGAGRARVVRQLLAESVALSWLGGLAGLIVAAWGVALLRPMAAATLPRAQHIEVIWPVAYFAFGLSIVTGLIFGLAPAIQAVRSDIRAALNEEGRGGMGGAPQRRMRAALVVVEIGLALVLLVGAGLLLRSFSALTRVSPGFDPSNVLAVNLPLSPQRYAGPVARAAAVDRILERVRVLPGVRSAGMTTTLPMAGPGATIHFNRAAFPPKGPDDYVMTGFRAVTPDYLATLGAPLVKGRLLNEWDREGSPRVAVINESMASVFFPGLEPIGQRLQLGTEPDPNSPPIEVVGVVGDMRQSFVTGPNPELFLPYAQHPDPVLTGIYLSTILVVRTESDPFRVVSGARAAVHEVDPGQPLVNVRTMEGAIAGTIAQPRIQATLLIVFAAVAVALAAIGVYGVVSYTVSQRIPELGVRMAIGASPNRVVAMVVWEGAKLALVGLALGLVAAAIAGRAVESMLFEVSGLDPLTFGAAPAVLVVAALVATYIPARRIAKVTPLSAISARPPIPG